MKYILLLITVLFKIHKVKKLLGKFMYYIFKLPYYGYYISSTLFKKGYGCRHLVRRRKISVNQDKNGGFRSFMEHITLRFW